MTEERMRVLGALAKAAARFPNLRLGQIIGNAIPPTPSGPGSYYASDAELAQWLEAYTRKAGK